MKKILSFLLGLTLLMSLTVPALAATSDTIDKESLRVGYGVWPDDIQKTTSVGNEKKLLSSTIDKSSLRVGTGTWPENGVQAKLVLPNTEPRYEDAFLTSKALTINVDINSPLESQWRNTYSSYYY